MNHINNAPQFKQKLSPPTSGDFINLPIIRDEKYWKLQFIRMKEKLRKTNEETARIRARTQYYQRYCSCCGNRITPRATVAGKKSN